MAFGIWDGESAGKEKRKEDSGDSHDSSKQGLETNKSGVMLPCRRQSLRFSFSTAGLFPGTLSLSLSLSMAPVPGTVELGRNCIELIASNSPVLSLPLNRVQADSGNFSGNCSGPPDLGVHWIVTTRSSAHCSLVHCSLFRGMFDSVSLASLWKSEWDMATSSAFLRGYLRRRASHQPMPTAYSVGRG